MIATLIGVGFVFSMIVAIYEDSVRPSTIDYEEPHPSDVIYYQSDNPYKSPLE